MKINTLDNKDEIINILKVFSPYLDSLRSGRVDIEEVASKFASFAKVLLLTINETEVGFAAFYCNDLDSKAAYLSMIAVNPDYKRQGFGIELLRKMEKISKEEGMLLIRLEVSKQNIAAQSFYKNAGYYFIEENDTSIFMEKSL